MIARIFAIAFALAVTSTSAPALANPDSGPVAIQANGYAAGETHPDRSNFAHGAPADAYFGTQKMSVLGIRNRIRDVSLRMDVGVSVDPANAIHDMKFVEESIRDWERQYPSDSWLPRMVYALHHVYKRLRNDEASQHASQVGAWLIDRYPNSKEAIELRSADTQANSTGD